MRKGGKGCKKGVKITIVFLLNNFSQDVEIRTKQHVQCTVQCVQCT